MSRNCQGHTYSSDVRRRRVCWRQCRLKCCHTDLIRGKTEEKGLGGQFQATGRSISSFPFFGCWTLFLEQCCFGRDAKGRNSSLLEHNWSHGLSVHGFVLLFMGC